MFTAGMTAFFILRHSLAHLHRHCKKNPSIRHSDADPLRDTPEESEKTIASGRRCYSYINVLRTLSPASGSFLFNTFYDVYICPTQTAFSRRGKVVFSTVLGNERIISISFLY